LISIKQIKPTDAEYGQVWQLREDLLRKPIGLSLKDEDLGGEVNEVILAAFDGDDIAACLILQPQDDITIKLRQMAVAERWQGKGIGKLLVERAEEIAWDKGFEQIILHARKTATGFYERVGYRFCSNEFEEVGIPHFAMEKQKP
jgi:predicted GNAT family N-acyltransferase